MLYSSENSNFEAVSPSLEVCNLIFSPGDEGGGGGVDI